MSYPAERPRRLRRTAALRGLVAETRLHPADLIQPLFVREGLDEPRPIACMPGQVQHTRESVRKAAAAAVRAGVGGLLLFGIPETKDSDGRGAWDGQGITQLALADVAAEVGDATVVIGDINLDEYTEHGHVGVLDERGDVDNDATLAAYARVAVAQARAGAHMVAPSGMMDGQVGAIRRALDAAGHHNVPIMAYAAKYDSAFYGPFRDAVESRLTGTRSTHQQDPANLRESLREVLLDVDEGADMVMVKPAGLYLDVVRRVADAVHVPVAAYQVSGEYAAIEAAAANGWLTRDRAILESLTAIRRAGAGSVITYWATEIAERLPR
ncbi:porphobilinogen synthase [Nonomuraea roseoviolacea subsp. roseoviolacea]|uniref:Delta-aminolevulinic acid dehydratase n=1 Tax=Nonomuraea roseoviolacea subsp. carminata TaxID=160689 RepID=A0ABT1K6Y3_9ACTN|nr:porphobilinogen synthase [Nonomuraea roseoviolacea]MCP2349770.1 porphobilinogen synthase [Nonomuraea roseoviolacea subsp. carminata]